MKYQKYPKIINPNKAPKEKKVRYVNFFLKLILMQKNDKNKLNINTAFVSFKELAEPMRSPDRKTINNILGSCLSKEIQFFKIKSRALNTNIDVVLSPMDEPRPAKKLGEKEPAKKISKILLYVLNL